MLTKDHRFHRIQMYMTPMKYDDGYFSTVELHLNDRESKFCDGQRESRDEEIDVSDAMREILWQLKHFDEDAFHTAAAQVVGHDIP